METITDEHPTVAEGGAGDPTADARTEKLRPQRTPLRAAVVAMRPQEWIKNVLVFAGVLFSGKVDDVGALATATLAFVAFCAISSAGYLINDINDVEFDRAHPNKRDRPIAVRRAGRAHRRDPRSRTYGCGAGARLRDRELAGRPDGRRLRRRAARLQLRAEADRDRRCAGHRRAVHPPRRRRRRGRRRPCLGVADSLYRDARLLPRLHQAPPGGGLRASPGDRKPAGAGALFAAVSWIRWSRW